MVRRPKTLIRAGLVGLWVGVLPALGVSLAGIASYLFEKKYSNESEQFGKGAPSGLMAAEVGKGACVVGDLIPTFTLGVPGSVTGALLMAALIVHGIAPGPMFLLSGAMPYAVFMGIILAQGVFLVSGLLLAKYMAKVVFVPNAILAPGIVVICVLGAYAERNSVWDIMMMFGFGLLAYALEKAGYSVVCLVLGLILGNLVETNFHRALSISMGSWSIFLTRPLTLAMLVVTALFLLGPWIAAAFSALTRRRAKPAAATTEVAEEHKTPAQAAAKEELILLALLMAVSVGMVVEGRNYEPAVALFPNLIAALMLLMSLWRVYTLIKDGVLKASWQITRLLSPGPLFGNALSWHWSVIGLVGYSVLIALVGFIIATGVYMALVPVLLGYRRWGVIAAVTVLTPAALFAVGSFFHLFLPAGILAS